MASIEPTWLRTRRQGRRLVVVWILFAALGPASAREPEIEDLRVERIGDQFLASFRVTGAFTDDVEERIASGLETRFRHRIRVLLRRTGLPDKTLQQEELTTTVKYDALNRQYVLSRLLNGTLRESEFTCDEGRCSQCLPSRA